MLHDVFFISCFRNKSFNLHLQWGTERKSASCLEELSGFLNKEEVPMRQTGRAESQKLMCYKSVCVLEGRDSCVMLQIKGITLLFKTFICLNSVLVFF